MATDSERCKIWVGETGSETALDHIHTSLTWATRVGSLSTASFRLEATASVALPVKVGQKIRIRIGTLVTDTEVWGGTVARIAETDVMQGATTRRFITVTCQEFREIASRRMAVEVYESQTLGAIVADLITNYLSAEGITSGTVATGPTVKKVVFNYVPVDRALDELSTLTGYVWRITPNLELDFQERAANSAPLAITPTSRPYRDIQITHDRTRYRNTQYLRGGEDLTSSRAESFKGDGTRKTYTLSFPAGVAPTITVNTVSKTVGILGLDTGKDWYWNKKSKTITQDDGAGALTSSDTLEVTYQGLFPIMVKTQNEVEIFAQEEIGGGTGIYEAVDGDASLDDNEAAIDKANALLQQYGAIDTRIVIQTDEVGVVAGQLMSISLPEHELGGDFLVEEVAANDRGDYVARYSITCIGNREYGGWVDFFHKLAAGGENLVIRENESLILLKSPADVLNFTESVVARRITSGTYTVDNAYTVVGFCDVG